MIFLNPEEANTYKNERMKSKEEVMMENIMDRFLEDIRTIVAEELAKAKKPTTRTKKEDK